MKKKIKILTNYYISDLKDIDNLDIVLFNGKREDEGYYYHQRISLFSNIVENLPKDWEPDFVLFHTPFYYPIPIGIEDSPWPTIAILDDWFGGIDYMPDVLQLFDYIFTDKYSLKILSQMGFTNIAYWPAFGHRESNFYNSNSIRDIDISFIGNLNGNIQFERFNWLRKAVMVDTVKNGMVGTGIFNDDYRAILNRSKIGFNRTIKGEMNLRAFEVPACGALLFIEEENREVRDFLIPGKECILYNESNVEELIRYYLTHDTERETIAKAGEKKIANFSFKENYKRLIAQIQSITFYKKNEKKTHYSDNIDHLRFIQTSLAGGINHSNFIRRFNILFEQLDGDIICNDMGVMLLSYISDAKICTDTEKRHLLDAVKELFIRSIDNEEKLASPYFNLIQAFLLDKDYAKALEISNVALEAGNLIHKGFLFPITYHSPHRYLWNNALVDDTYSREKLLHYFIFIARAEVYEKLANHSLVIESYLEAIEIYPHIPYGLEKFAQFLLTIEEEEIFRPFIYDAFKSSPFNPTIIKIALKILGESSEGIEFSNYIQEMLSKLTPFTRKSIEEAILR